MYSKSILNDIRDRISIVSLVGERIPLKRAGRNHTGLCPFHREKTPSFSVNDEKGIYHCFGCGEGGDVFQFLMKFDNISFAEAVKALAARAGVTLPAPESTPAARAAEDEKAKRRRLLLRVNEIARDYFLANLEDPARGGIARKYLNARGIIEDKIFKQHFLGYAENSWDALTRHLETKGVPLNLANELGLVKARDGGGYYDFFRHRIIFPIISPKGETIGFGGRALEGVVGESGAKYLNSPDSPLYHKSSCVYGVDRSAAAIRASGQVVLVEGYMDFIALHQSGIENVAAPLGTALTEGHVTQLARFTRDMVLIFDGDEAGARASIRALSVFIDAGIMPRVVILPAGEDPDTLVRKEGADAFRARIDRARPLFEHYVDVTASETGLDSAGKVSALSRIAPILKRVSDPVEAAVLMQFTARRLDVDEKTVAAAASGSSQAPAQRKDLQQAARNAPEPCGSMRSAERLLVQAMIVHPATIPVVFESVAPADFSDEWCRTAVGLIMDAWHGADSVNMAGFIDGLEDNELATQLRAVAMDSRAVNEEDVGALVSDCVAALLKRPTLTRIEAINDDIRRAQGDGDDARIMALLAEKNMLIGKLHARGDLDA